MGRKAEGIVLLKDSDETEQRIQWDSSMVQCSGNSRYSDNSQFSLLRFLGLADKGWGLISQVYGPKLMHH